MQLSCDLFAAKLTGKGLRASIKAMTEALLAHYSAPRFFRCHCVVTVAFGAQTRPLARICSNKVHSKASPFRCIKLPLALHRFISESSSRKQLLASVCNCFVGLASGLGKAKSNGRANECND